MLLEAGHSLGPLFLPILWDQESIPVSISVYWSHWTDLTNYPAAWHRGPIRGQKKPRISLYHQLCHGPKQLAEGINVSILYCQGMNNSVPQGSLIICLWSPWKSKGQSAGEHMCKAQFIVLGSFSSFKMTCGPFWLPRPCLRSWPLVTARGKNIYSPEDYRYEQPTYLPGHIEERP